MLRVMTYNIRDGGVGGDVGDRLPLIHELVRSSSPDVLAVQEANHFEAGGERRLLAFEGATGLRGFLGRSPSGYHGVLFVRPDLQPTTVRSDDAAGNRSRVELICPGPDGRRLTIVAVHLDPVSPETRLVGTLNALGTPPAILMGDLNNCRADDPRAEDLLARLPPRQRARAGTDRLDDRLFAALEQAGYVDLFRRLHPGEPGHTFPRPGLRLDYVFATEDLASRAVSCDVVRRPPADIASDHYPLMADIDIALGPAEGSP